MRASTDNAEYGDSGKEANGHHHERAARVLAVEEMGVAQQFEDVDTAKVLRKIDWRLLPVLSFLYLLAFLDRSNLGNAKVAGLADDLALTGTQFNLAATVWLYLLQFESIPRLTASQVFFFPYCLLEIPANVMLKILRPSRWIGCLVIAWGTVRTPLCLVQHTYPLTNEL